MSTQFVPLKLWAWVAVLFISSQILIVFLYNVNEAEINKVQYDHYFDQLNFLKQELKKNDDSYKVVIIGTSLTGHGVACLDELDEYLVSNQKLKLIKIWSSRDRLKLFIKNDLINQLLKYKPDLVIFQTELAAIDFEEKNIWLKKMTELSSMNKKMIKHLVPFTKKNKYNPKDRCGTREMRAISIDTITFTPLKRDIKDITNLTALTNSLNLLSNAGVKLVIADIPKPEKTKEIIYTTLFTEKLQKLLQIYHEKYGVNYWAYSGQPIYFKHCKDQAHLNKEGRKIYTKWLINKIEAEK